MKHSTRTMNTSKAQASFQRHRHEQSIGLSEQSLVNFEVENKKELFESVEMTLSHYDKEKARKRIQKVVNQIKEDRDQVEQNLRINFELAKARMTENDLICSSKANRIVAAMAMDRVIRNAEQLERIKKCIIQLKELRDDIVNDIKSIHDIDGEIDSILSPLNSDHVCKKRTYSDQQLLTHLSRTLLKTVLD